AGGDHRLCRRIGPARVRGRRLPGRDGRRPVWPSPDDVAECRPVPHQRRRDRPGGLGRRIHSLAAPGRAGHRRRPGGGARGASVLAPMYIAEVAPSHMRGRLASLQQMAIVSGLFGAFLSNDIIARVAGGASATFWLGVPAWRWMFWIEAVPSIAFLAGVWLIPESPRFLVAHGRPDDARRVLAHIRGDADALVRPVLPSPRGEHRPRLSDLIVEGTRRLAPVVWIGMGLAVFQQ